MEISWSSSMEWPQTFGDFTVGLNVIQKSHRVQIFSAISKPDSVVRSWSKMTQNSKWKYNIFNTSIELIGWLCPHTPCVYYSKSSSNSFAANYLRYTQAVSLVHISEDNSRITMGLEIKIKKQREMKWTKTTWSLADVWLQVQQKILLVMLILELQKTFCLACIVLTPKFFSAWWQFRTCFGGQICFNWLSFASMTFYQLKNVLR